MEKIRQGDVYWVDFGEPEGSEPGFIRPCVVVQNDVFNSSRINTVVVCAITSNLKLERSPGNVLLKKGEAKLPKDSVVNITQLVTVDKDFLVEKIGTLPTVKIRRVLDGISLLLRPTQPFTARRPTN